MMAGILCMFVNGCKKAADDTVVEPTTEQTEEVGTEMKSAEELQQEAEQNITEENVQEELDKIEQEIDANMPVDANMPQ